MVNNKDYFIKHYERHDILTLGQERLYNPFLRTTCEQIKRTFPQKSDKEIFITLRSMRDQW